MSSGPSSISVVAWSLDRLEGPHALQWDVRRNSPTPPNPVFVDRQSQVSRIAHTSGRCVPRRLGRIHTASVCVDLADERTVPTVSLLGCDSASDRSVSVKSAPSPVFGGDRGHRCINAGLGCGALVGRGERDCGAPGRRRRLGPRWLAGLRPASRAITRPRRSRHRVRCGAPTVRLKPRAPAGTRLPGGRPPGPTRSGIASARRPLD